MSIVNTLKRVSKTVTMLVVATMVSYGAVTCVKPSIAEAGARKKVQFVTKGINKFGRELEVLGRNAQRSRGVGHFVGGILKNAGKGTRNLGRTVDRSVNVATRGVNRALSKSKVGRTVQGGWRNAQRFQNNLIDNAFRGCRGGLCDGARNAVRFAAPM